MSNSGSAPLGRRGFLKGVVIAGGASIAAPVGAQAQVPADPQDKLAPPTAAARQAESEPPPELPALTTERSGSDFMVDVCKTLSLDYMAACPGSTFRGLQESFINYGRNISPEWLTCLHEEISVGMAHGYAKVAGKPMAAMVHGTVGTQHAAMAIYNAYCDRVPIIIITGNAGAADERRPGVEWIHSVQDGAATVRDFVKWDDYPRSLQHFSESMVRGYALACAQPPGPVFITADAELQEGPLHAREQGRLSIPRLMMPSQSVGDANALAEAAKMLVAAQSPVIIADRYARSQQGMDNLVKLAELLQALVDKQPTGTIYVAWDNADTHEDDEVEAVLRAAAGRLVLLYLPTYSPWLNPIEMLWRPFRREVTHCELFETVEALLRAAQDFFDRHNRVPQHVLSIIGSHPAKLS